LESLIRVPETPSTFHQHAQTKRLSVVAMRVSNKGRSPARIHQQGRLLKHPEDLEDDHDNDDYSDYVEDACVHASD
jgi:hypothetical protein